MTSSKLESTQQTSTEQPQEIPYQHQGFVDFIAILGRLFYDDPSIVILDLLASEQRAFSESDLKEKLGWRESLIQQKLYLLEKHAITVQETHMTRGNSRGGVYWRINHHVYAAVQYRYQQLINRLSHLLDSLATQHEFECSKPECGQCYTSLQAAACSRSLDTEHPLCSKCGSLLKSSEFEATRVQAKKKCSRALEQLDPLQQKLRAVANMIIPVFKPYSKTEKYNVASEIFEEKPDSTADETSSSDHTPAAKRQTMYHFWEDSAMSNTTQTRQTTIPWFTDAKTQESCTPIGYSKIFDRKKPQINFALKKTF